MQIHYGSHAAEVENLSDYRPLIKYIMFFTFTLLMANLQAQPISGSFELRYFTSDEGANGETDFHGETEVFDTDQRIQFLRQYGEYAKEFFDDPSLDTKVVTDKEAEEFVNGLKQQPLPSVRSRIIPETWKWMGFRPGQREEEMAELDSWKNIEGVEVTGQALVFQSSGASFERDIPDQYWRFNLRFDIGVPTENCRFSLALSGGRKHAADVGVDDSNNFYYTSGGKMIQLGPCRTNDLHSFQLEVDLVNDRYNLYIDEQLMADFAELSGRSVKQIESLVISGTEGVIMDNIYGVSYQPTEEILIPYTVNTFLDEDFKVRPSISGWTSEKYDDSQWDETILPKVHGGDRFAGEDIYLRKQLRIGDFSRAVLNFEILDPGGEIWINGSPVAIVHDKHPVRVDVSKYLKRNSENLIAVRVNSFMADVPLEHSGGGDPNIGWFAGRMHLDLTERTFIDEVLVHTEGINEAASMRHRIMVENKTKESFEGMVDVCYYPWFPEESEECVAKAGFPFQVNASSRIEIDKMVQVENPLLWTADNPSLYKVEFLLKDTNGVVLDDFVVTTGIRTISQEGGVFRINGEPAMLNGAQIFGCRMPPDKIAMWNKCAPASELAKELLQIKRMNGNFLRVHVHTEKYKADGTNDPRIAEMSDQLGIMILWQSPAWIRNGSFWNVDFEGYPEYIRQVYHHPSIVMWEIANHPWPWSRPYTVDETNRIFTKVYNTIYPVDPSRLIIPASFHRVFNIGNDAGTIDGQGNPIETVDAFRAPMITRANHDYFTGYGRKWDVLRKMPESGDPTFSTVSDLVNSPHRAYFNFEQQESIGQPNWSLVKGKPWYQLQSYEWFYDKGSIGRLLQVDEWLESQAWQAFSAWEAMKKQRILDYDGFSWCCLHGGANMGTYKKPLIDCLGHAKLAYHANKMIFQPVVAGSDNVDVVYGPDDEIRPVIMNLGDSKRVSLKVVIKSLDGKVVAEKNYTGIELPGGRTLTKLEAFKPEIKDEDTYAVEYRILSDD